MSTDMDMMATLKNQLKAAIDARRGSIVALRARIYELLADVPVGVRLSDEEGELIRIRKVYSAASQWANDANPIRTSGKGVVTPNSHVVAHEDMDGYAGSNVARAFGPILDRDGDTIPYLTAAETRKIALRLPAAIVRYMAQCEAERSANDATLGLK